MLRHRFILLALLVSSSSLAKEVSFKKGEILLGKHIIQVEFARSDLEQQRGLMYRTEPLKENHGMLFEFNETRVLSFWMKNTFIPLSIGFFDENKKLVFITKMQAVHSEMETPKSYSSVKPAKYALEMNSGWFEKNKVELGTVFKYR